MSLRDCESEVFDVNLNEIDDKEFDIPPIGQQPTLDSILSLPDDDQSLVDSEVSFAAEFPFPGHAPFVHPVGVFAIFCSQRSPKFWVTWVGRLGDMARIISAYFLNNSIKNEPIFTARRYASAAYAMAHMALRAHVHIHIAATRCDYPVSLFIILVI